MKNRRDEIRVFPNPARDKLFIEVKEMIEVKLFNLLGKEILATKQKELDVSDLPNGIYFVSVTTPTGTITKKMLLQH